MSRLFNTVLLEKKNMAGRSEEFLSQDSASVIAWQQSGVKLVTHCPLQPSVIA